MLLLGIYLKDSKMNMPQTHLPISICAALFTIAKLWKNSLGVREQGADKENVVYI